MIPRLVYAILLLSCFSGFSARATEPCADDLRRIQTPRVLLDPRGVKRGILWSHPLPAVVINTAGQAASDLIEFPAPWKPILESAEPLGYISDTDTLLMLATTGELWAWHLKEERAVLLAQLISKPVILTNYLFGTLLSIEQVRSPPLWVKPHTGRVISLQDEFTLEAIQPSAQRVDFTPGS